MRNRKEPVVAETADTITTAEAAQTLGLTEPTVRRLVATGQLPGRQVRGHQGRELRIDRGALAAYRLVRAPGPETVNRKYPSAPEPQEPETDLDRALEDNRLLRAQPGREMDRALEENAILSAPCERGLDRALKENALLRSNPAEITGTAQPERPWWRWWRR